MREEPYEQSVILHPGMRGRIDYASTPTSRFGTGPRVLIDGITGSLEADDGTWAMFPGKDLNAVLTLDAPRRVRRVLLTVLVRREDRIREPAEVVFEISADGKEYTRLDPPVATRAQGTGDVSVIAYGSSQQLPVAARFIRVAARNPGPVPNGDPGEGQETILCFDELIVE
jgi:hexosaminidase